MTLLVLGPEGTFSHELAIRAFAEEIIIPPTIHEIFSQVEQGAGDGLVPIENSEAGGVGPTLDGLLQHRVFITAELYMPVHHHLAGFTPVPDITVLYAHPQTHEQCSRIVNALQVPVIHTSSNAASAGNSHHHPGGGSDRLPDDGRPLQGPDTAGQCGEQSGQYDPVYQDLTDARQ